MDNDDWGWNWEHLGPNFFESSPPGAIEPPQPHMRYFISGTREGVGSIEQLSIAEVRDLLGFDNTTNTEQENGMNWKNEDAAELAREMLRDKSKGELKDRVEEAVAHLQELIGETSCGSTLTFMKTSATDDSKHYFYAVVKNGTTWYTTAQSPRILNGDDELIEWLIGLEIWEADQLQMLPLVHAHELAAPIDTTAVDS